MIFATIVFILSLLILVTLIDSSLGEEISKIEAVIFVLVALCASISAFYLGWHI